MASFHGGGNYRAVVVQDGDGPPRVAQLLLDGQADPSAASLQALADAYALNADKFGTPVTVRVVKVMRPGPLWAVLDDSQYRLLSGVNDDGSVGTPQTNDDPNGQPYTP